MSNDLLEKLGSNNTVVGCGSNMGEYDHNCCIFGAYSKLPDHCKNVILMGRGVTIPEDFPRENAIYIGNNIESLFIDHNGQYVNCCRLEGVEKKMLELAKNLAENSDGKQIFYNVKGNFRDLAKDVAELKYKVDILWNEREQKLNESVNQYLTET